MTPINYAQIDWLFDNELHKLIYWTEIPSGYGRTARLVTETYDSMPQEFKDLI